MERKIRSDDTWTMQRDNAAKVTLTCDQSREAPHTFPGDMKALGSAERHCPVGE